MAEAARTGTLGTMTHKRIALVTGASSGIGADAAVRLADAGFVVYGAARRQDRLEPLARHGVRPLALDVTDEESLTAAVAHVVAESGRIDVLVNNAGYGSYGAIEDVDLEEARRQFDVNVFGLARLTQLVLPHMRAQRSGTIINVSSMGGRFVTPLGAWYHASKYAVEALSDALRIEARPFGIHVAVVEPGSIRTEWGAIAAEQLLATSAETGAYTRLADGVARTLAASSAPANRTASGPGVVGRTIVRIAQSRRPRTRYRVGFGAIPATWLKAILPERAFDRLIRLAFGV